VLHYSDTWQLVINTGTTIITFLMVFRIQNTQNRDARDNLRLNELIHAVDKARDQMIDIENLSDLSSVLGTNNKALPASGGFLRIL
jgi:low affinity Fe/Cu permease